MSTQLTAEDHRLGERWALDNGTHALLHKVVQNKPCGCTVEGAGNLKSPVRVKFCGKHEKALGVIRKLRDHHECTTPAENFCRVCKIIEDAGFVYRV